MKSTEGRQHDADGGSGWRILIVGTGGQGVLTVARLLCDSFVALGHNVVSGQLHGMAQRGGSVQSSVMIDCGISPLIARGGADFVLGFEPVETARALPYMSSGTVVYMNSTPVIPYVVGQRSVLGEGGARYPEVKELAASIGAVTRRVFCFDATQLAQQAGSAATVNVVMLGCLIGSGLMPSAVETFWDIAEKRVPPKAKEANARAFRRGVEKGRAFQLGGGKP